MSDFSEASAVEAMARGIAFEDLNGRMVTPAERLQLVDIHWPKSVRQAQAALAALKPFMRGGWQTMETAWKDGRTIIAYHHSWYEPATVRWSESGYWHGFPNQPGPLKDVPEMWMPFPHSPLEKCR